MTAEHPFVHTDSDGGLILATRLPGSADELGEYRLDWRDLGATVDEPPLWIHLDRTRERAQRWIQEDAGLDPLVAGSLLADETRPMFHAYGSGLLVILRGVNMNPGAEPDELITVRLWVEPHRVITLRHRRFRTLVELRRRAQRSEAPATTGAFLSAVANGLAVRMGPSVRNLEEIVDDIEAAMLDAADDDPAHRTALANVRRQAISLRRYLVPQRDALRGLAGSTSPILAPQDLAELRLAAEQVTRVAEALEEVRDRAAVTQDEMRARHEARVGRTLYLLTIVATVALPLSILTGLLGINVGGIPLADSPLGFVIVCAGLVALGVIEVMLLRLLRLI